MRTPLPTMTESVDDLKAHFKQERHPVKQVRLRALYLLASGQAHSRQELAALLGVDRNTVGRWLAVYVPAGKRKPLTLDQLQRLQYAHAQPQGFASFGVIQQWIAVTFGVQFSYNATRKLVRYKLGEQVQAVIPPSTKQAVEIWAMDESRLGLHTIRRRRITACGNPPSAPINTLIATFTSTGRLHRTLVMRIFWGCPH